MKKYSPHHPQIILPLSVAYTGTYQPSCVTLTIRPPSPSPSPPPPPPQARKRCIQAFSLIIRFSIVFFASESRARISCHRLDVPRSAAVHRGRDRFRITHTRDSQSSYSSALPEIFLKRIESLCPA